MALHTFIDGYNLIGSSRWLDAGGLKEKQLRLIGFLEERRSLGSTRNQTTVVFDGRPGPWGPPSSRVIRVLFSGEAEADDIIKGEVDALSNPREAVVVTNDRAIQRWVRGAHARVVSCKDFLAESRPSNVDSSSEKPDPDVEKKINDELRRRWNVR